MMAWDTQTVIKTASAVIFLAFAALTIFGAVVAATAHRLMRNVCGLALSFLGLAGLYYFLHSPFLALMQILIYVGAICIVIMFALMMAEPHDEPSTGRRESNKWWAGLLLAAVFAAVAIIVTINASWMPASTPLNDGGTRDIGWALLYRYGFVFELVSVLLLLAIAGALVVAGSGRRSGS
jgi:NADH:ubiquinone oxidoreductase subunit 6 (subunit J)